MIRYQTDNDSYEESLPDHYRSCFVHGAPVGKLSKASWVSIGICGGVTGLINHENKYLYIEPVHRDPDNEEPQA